MSRHMALRQLHACRSLRLAMELRRFRLIRSLFREKLPVCVLSMTASSLPGSSEISTRWLVDVQSKRREPCRIGLNSSVRRVRRRRVWRMWRCIPDASLHPAYGVLATQSPKQKCNEPVRFPPAPRPDRLKSRRFGCGSGLSPWGPSQSK